MTEPPSDFESYFVKMQRRNSQTLQEYQAEYLHTERRLTMVHKIELPEKIRGMVVSPTVWTDEGSTTADPDTTR